MIQPNPDYLAIPFIALWVVYSVVYYFKHRARLKKRIKPFDCPLCLTFWAVLSFELVNVYQSFTLYNVGSLIVNCIVYCMVATLIEKIFKSL